MSRSIEGGMTAVTALLAMLQCVGCASSGEGTTVDDVSGARRASAGGAAAQGGTTTTTTTTSAPPRSLSGTQSSTAPQGSAPPPFDVERARAVFVRTCAACHGARGQGVIGPNLTDGVGFHPVTDVSGYEALVRDGVTTRGMPAWGRVLTAEEVSLLAQFSWSLRNTNDPEGKAPQGEYPLR